MKKLYELPDNKILEFLDKLGICSTDVRGAFEKHLPSKYGSRKTERNFTFILQKRKTYEFKRKI